MHINALRNLPKWVVNRILYCLCGLDKAKEMFVESIVKDPGGWQNDQYRIVFLTDDDIIIFIVRQIHISMEKYPIKNIMKVKAEVETSAEEEINIAIGTVAGINLEIEFVNGDKLAFCTPHLDIENNKWDYFRFAQMLVR